MMELTQSNYANQSKRLSKDNKRSNFVLIYYSLAIIIYSLSIEFFPNNFDATWFSYSSLILSVIVLVYSIINNNANYPERISKIQCALQDVQRLKREIGTLPDEEDKASLLNNNQKNVCPNPCSAQCDCKTYAQCAAAKNCLKFERIKENYDEIIRSTEMLDDLDFYHTIRPLCKQYGINCLTGKLKGSTEKSLEGKGHSESSDDLKELEASIDEIRGYIAENNPLMQGIHLIFLRIYHIILYAAPVAIFAIGFFSNEIIVAYENMVH